MTKAELILKIAKNVGIPDTDTKKFFELFLKKISAVIDIGQSVYLKDFGYFYMIRGSIKKPVFSFTDNQVSEEQVDLVLFSEHKDLKKSETKGLVFNIPVFDDEDYHPIDSAFSLSIGKPLIPLRGVPFEDMYIPSSGYEYKRLIESKVEKLVASSEIIETEEKFPVLVIDARSYNSNQVQLQWDEETDSKVLDRVLNDEFVEEKPEISEYEKQSNELRNIAWDFGEDLSQQIEAESILDIADERLKLEFDQLNSDKRLPEKVFEVQSEVQQGKEDNGDNKDEVAFSEKLNEEFINETGSEDSSAKLDELLNSEPRTSEYNDVALYDDRELKEDEIEILENPIEFEFENKNIQKEDADQYLEEEISITDDTDDKDFWKTSSKYFETYNPVTAEHAENNDSEIEAVPGDLQPHLESNIEVPENTAEEIIEEVVQDSEIENGDSQINEGENNMDDESEIEKTVEQQPEFFEPEKKRNFVPVILFSLLIIIVSIALYWYLEFYKKNEIKITYKTESLKTDKANIISRSFEIPVSYPYKPKEYQTTISENSGQTKETQNITVPVVDKTKNQPDKTDQKKEVDKKPVNIENQNGLKNNTANTQKNIVNNEILPVKKSLNVGNNIYKYGNYYVVQVAAFRSSAISENEAGKYKNKGYNAFVETATIPDRGTWYRVRVGNFTSKDEAQRFLENNIR